MLYQVCVFDSFREDNSLNLCLCLITSIINRLVGYFEEMTEKLAMYVYIYTITTDTVTVRCAFIHVYVSHIATYSHSF